MSTLTVKGLPWAVLRLHRTALVVWGVFVVAVVGALLWLNTVTADSVVVSTDYSGPTGWISTFICYSFFAVAAFAGGALIGRELESGTAQLAWTQSVSPARWLATKLAVPALLLTAGGTVLVLTFRWGWSANRDLMGDTWAFNDVFVARGPAMVAYALCALAVGALVGLVVRRSLPALGISFGLMVVFNSCLTKYRFDLWPAVTRTSATPFELPNSAEQLQSGVFVGAGHRVADLDYLSCDGTPAQVKSCVDDFGITGHYSVYQPASHFWPLHLVETGIVLAVAVLATAAAFWVLLRRTPSRG